MRNITVSVDEQTHWLARIRAAELDTSVSALVAGLPEESGCGPRQHSEQRAKRRGGDRTPSQDIARGH